MEKRKLTSKPFKSGGTFSRSLQFVIPAPIVKEYGINESTVFIVDHNDHGITLSYAKVEYKNKSVGFGLENLSQPITYVAGDKNRS